MKCAVCGTENEAEARFCVRCGSPMAVAPATGKTVNLNSLPEASFAEQFNEQAGGSKIYDPTTQANTASTGTGQSFSSYSQPAQQPQNYGNAPAQQTQQPQNYGGAGVPMPGQMQSYVMPQPGFIPATNSMAVASLVLSILSFIMLPFIGAIAGIILGYKGRSEIRASQGRETGEGMATAGIIVGWVHMALIGLAVLAICALAVLGAAVGN